MACSTLSSTHHTIQPKAEPEPKKEETKTKKKEKSEKHDIPSQPRLPF
jgi:hypothetical protein